MPERDARFLPSIRTELKSCMTSMMGFVIFRCGISRQESHAVVVSNFPRAKRFPCTRASMWCMFSLSRCKRVASRMIHGSRFMVSRRCCCRWHEMRSTSHAIISHFSSFSVPWRSSFGSTIVLYSPSFYFSFNKYLPTIFLPFFMNFLHNSASHRRMYLSVFLHTHLMYAFRRKFNRKWKTKTNSRTVRAERIVATDNEQPTMCPCGDRRVRDGTSANIEWPPKCKSTCFAHWLIFRWYFPPFLRTIFGMNFFLCLSPFACISFLVPSFEQWQEWPSQWRPRLTSITHTIALGLTKHERREKTIN